LISNLDGENGDDITFGGAGVRLGLFECSVANDTEERMAA
jgi:hypothetical protein